MQSTCKRSATGATRATSAARQEKSAARIEGATFTAPRLAIGTPRTGPASGECMSLRQGVGIVAIAALIGAGFTLVATRDHMAARDRGGSGLRVSDDVLM